MALRELAEVGNYKKLVTARFISNVGNGMSPIAMSFGVLGLEGTNEFSLSLVMFSVWVPMVVLMLFGGVIADRVNRTLLVGGMDIFAAAVTILQAVLFLTHTANIPLLCITNAAFGVGVAMWWPAFGGLMPEIVEEEHLQSAKSVMAFLANFGMIIGAFIGGVLVATTGPGWALGIDGLSFILAGALVLMIRLEDRESRQDNESSMLNDIVHGWREVRSRHWVVAVVIAFAFYNMAFEAMITVLGPLQFDTIFGGADDWGLAMGAQGLGMLLGVAVAVKFRPKEPMAAAMVAILAPVMLMYVIAVHPPMVVVVPAAFVAGFGLDVFFILWVTTVQKHIPQDLLSRVFSYDALGSNILVPVGLIVAGPLASRTSPSTALLIGAIIGTVSILATFAVRDVRHMPELATTNS